MNEENFKKRSRCGKKLLTNNFHRDKKTKDGLYNQCKSFRKECYFEKLVKVKK